MKKRVLHVVINLHECFGVVAGPLLEVTSGLEATKPGIARNSSYPEEYMSQAKK
jgi:hypothetical protein